MDAFCEQEALVLPEMLTLRRAAELLLVLEGIYGPETEADETTKDQEKPQTRNLPAMWLHLANDPRTLPPLPEGT